MGAGGAAPAAPPRGGGGGDAFLSLPAVRGAARGPLAVYASRRRAGLYRKDPRQENAMLELQRLYDDLEAAAAPRSSGMTMVEAIGGDRGGGGGSWLSSLFGPGDAFSAPADPSGAGSPSSSASTPRGLYMYGGVGTGKTMLMDVFSECVSPLVPVRFVSLRPPCFSPTSLALFVRGREKNAALFLAPFRPPFPLSPLLSFRDDEIKLKTTIAVQSEGGP